MSRFGCILLLVLVARPLDAQQDSGRAAASPDSTANRSTGRAAPAPRALQARRIPSTAPVLDGRLDEPGWRGGSVARNFVQHEPRPGAGASQRSEVRVLFDHEALYIGARLFDSHPDSIVAQLAGRDEEVFSDWIYVQLDSDLDRRTAFEFGVNPASVKWDALIHGDTETDPGWDAVWDAVAQRDSAGWTAEIRIPFSQLRFRLPKDTTVVSRWGVNFRRHIARREETSDWTPIPRNSSRLVSLFGTLQGIRGIKPPTRLEIQPYLVTRLVRSPEETGNPFWRRNDLGQSVGADVKYGLTPGLTLSATFNPDFAEVEADRPYVRLNSEHEPFFPEKRPFFLEGAEIFRFNAEGPSIFHSRSIGQQPRQPRLTSGSFADVPSATPILGAVKLSGKPSRGWSIGLLNAVSGEVKARIMDGSGAIRKEPVEPLTNFAVGRLTRDLNGGNTTVGGIVTATNRALDDPALEHLRSGAYAAGVDFWHRLPRQVEITGMFVRSEVRGSTEALRRLQRAQWHLFQREDAEHLDYDSMRVALGGFSSAISAYRYGGSAWGWVVGATARSAGFEVNDAGYQTDADVVSQYSYLRYARPEPGKLFRRWHADLTQTNKWSFGRERLGVGAALSGGLQLHNYWGGTWGLTRDLAGLHVRMLNGGAALVTPARTTTSFSVYTDHRRRVTGSVSGGAARDDEGGGRLLRLASNVAFRPSKRIDLAVAPSISWYSNPWQLASRRQVKIGGELDTVFVVGRLRQTTAILAPRLRYTFSPALSLQFHAYPFISSGAYSDYKEVTDPHAARFRDRFHRYTPTEIAYDSAASVYRVDRTGDGKPDFAFAGPDYSFKDMRAQAVLSWEYRPGSTLFVVWRQDRADRGVDGSFDLRRDAASLLGLREDLPVPVTNSLVVKFSYWLGM